MTRSQADRSKPKAVSRIDAAVGPMPELPASTPSQLRPLLTAMKQFIDVRGGKRGHKLDQAVTMRDLVDTGMFGISSSTLVADPTGVTDTVNTGYSTEVPPPPKVLFDVIANVLRMTWQIVGAPEISHTEIWVDGPYNPLDGDLPTTSVNPSTAGTSCRLLASVDAQTFALPLESGMRYFVFVRFISKAGIVGQWHSGAGTAIDTDFTAADMAVRISEDLQDSAAWSYLSGTEPDFGDRGWGHRWDVSSAGATGVEYGGLAYTIDGENKTTFMVLADQMGFGYPGITDEDVFPFAIGVHPTNGRTVVVMDGAYIKDASIDSASIDTLRANKITSGAIGAGMVQTNKVHVGNGGELIAGTTGQIEQYLIPNVSKDLDASGEPNYDTAVVVTNSFTPYDFLNTDAAGEPTALPPEGAAFVVRDDGTLIATQAYIRGNVTATDITADGISAVFARLSQAQIDYLVLYGVTQLPANSLTMGTIDTYISVYSDSPDYSYTSWLDFTQITNQADPISIRSDRDGQGANLAPILRLNLGDGLEAWIHPDQDWDVNWMVSHHIEYQIDEVDNEGNVLTSHPLQTHYRWWRWSSSAAKGTKTSLAYDFDIDLSQFAGKKIRFNVLRACHRQNCISYGVESRTTGGGSYDPPQYTQVPVYDQYGQQTGTTNGDEIFQPTVTEYRYKYFDNSDYWNRDRNVSTGFEWTAWGASPNANDLRYWARRNTNTVYGIFKHNKSTCAVSAEILLT